MKRRRFIQTGAAGLLALKAFPVLSQVSSPNDKIQVACIGVGGMGQSNMNDFLFHDDCRVVAVCDVDPGKIAEASSKIKEKYGEDPAKYSDFREVLGREDIDAVMIGTPDHWHGLLAALACQSGKDVYVEKPLVHNIHEGRLAVNAARKNERVTQMGTQVHQTKTYARGVEIVQSGVLGEIHKIRVWIASNDAPDGIGNPEDSAVPEGVDYDTWLGPAPERPFNPNRFHFKWRYYWDYGGGTLADMACHIVDPVYWAVGLGAPKRIAGSGGRYVLRDNGETHDTQDVVWTYDPIQGQSSPVQLVWSLSNGNAHGLEDRGKGILFCGTEGTLLLDYGTYRLYNKADELVEESSITDDGLGKAGQNHKREFLDCIRSRERCSCDIEYGYQVTKVPLLGNLACRLGRTLEWDDATESFKDDAEANALLKREYRDKFSPKALGIEV